jgi:hypothetical protein
MTYPEMLEKMRGPEGFHQFGMAKVQRMFFLSWAAAYRWMDWLVDEGHAERIADRPREVRLI